MPAQNKKTKLGEAEVLIPDKLYFRIGEVSKLAKLPAYVLRFWETEFPQLKPNKSSTGQRLYRKHDVEVLLHIKQLLYGHGFTIAGARQHLKAEAKPAKSQTPLPFAAHTAAHKEGLKRIKRELKDILMLLSTKR